MPSVHGPDDGATANGVNTLDLDAEGVEDTTGEWSAAFEAAQHKAFVEHGAEYGTLPNSILFDTALTPTLKFVLTAMTVYSAGGRLSITQYALAKRLGISRQALSRTMNEAVAAGLLQRLESDGEVSWRLRWLSFKRQPQVDGQRQRVVDSQPQVDVPHAHAHAGSPVLSTSSTTKSTKHTIPLSDEELTKLHAEFDARLGSAQAVDDCIAAARNHKAIDKVKGEYRYFQTWLRTEARSWAKHKTDMAAANARLEKAKAPYQAASKPEPPPLKLEPIVQNWTPWQRAKSLWERETGGWGDPTDEQVAPYLARVNAQTNGQAS